MFVGFLEELASAEPTENLQKWMIEELFIFVYHKTIIATCNLNNNQKNVCV